MKEKRKYILFFRLSLLFMIILSTSFSLMPWFSDLAIRYNTRTPLIIGGSIFWLSLIMAYLLFVYVNVCRKRENNRSEVPGFLRFFSNKIAQIIDTLMVLTLIVYIYGLIQLDGFIMYVLLSLITLFIQLHAVVNGENFKYIQCIKKGDTYEINKKN